MTKQFMQPNLFNLATSELSHDAFFTWLLQWSHPKGKEFNTELHDIGRAFLKLVLEDKYSTDVNELIDIKAGRQWENIDVWAEIYCANRKILLVLENKTFSSEHSNQLVRYKEIGQEFCDKEGFELACAFVKTGSETVKLLNVVKEKGYKITQRKELISLLTSFQIHHPLVQDYLNYLQQLDFAEQQFETRLIKDWDGPCWVGFYQYLEATIPINMWHFVNNPGGGFWNCCLTWKYWDDIPVYMQIEQGKIAFKVALSEDETGFEPSEVDVNGIQDFLHRHLHSFADARGCHHFKSRQLVHRGAYRSIGRVETKDWIGNLDQRIDLIAVVNFLNELHGFYEGFIDSLRTEDYSIFYIQEAAIGKL